MLVFFLIIKGTDVLSIPSDLISVGHFRFGVTIKINQKKRPESVPEYHCVKDEIRRILANLFKLGRRFSQIHTDNNIFFLNFLIQKICVHPWPRPGFLQPEASMNPSRQGGLRPKWDFLYYQVIKKGKRSHIFLRV